MNKIDYAGIKAIGILREHNAGGWGVMITNSRTKLAVTDHNTKMIELSKRFILLSTLEQFEGVMHHEVAHILAGRGKAHGREFIRICQEIHSDEAYSCDNYPVRIGLYKYICPNCGVLGSQEKIKEIACAKCLSEGKLVDVEVVKNIITTTEWASTP